MAVAALASMRIQATPRTGLSTVMRAISFQRISSTRSIFTQRTAYRKMQKPANMPMKTATSSSATRVAPPSNCSSAVVPVVTNIAPRTPMRNAGMMIFRAAGFPPNTKYSAQTMKDTHNGKL